MTDYLMNFSSTHDCISSEAAVKEAGIKGRIIGTPEHISASCGLSLKYKEEDHPKVRRALESVDLKNETDVYAIVKNEDGTKDYQEINE